MISLGKEKCFKRMFPHTQKKFRIRCGVRAPPRKKPKFQEIPILPAGAPSWILPGFNLDIPRVQKKA